MKDRIIAYLGQGFSQVQVVSMTGASAAYVSQVANEHEADIEEEAKKHKKTQEEEKIEQGYVKLEAKVQKAMEDNLPFAEFADLTKAMGLLIQRRQRHATPTGIVHDNRQQFVILQVPQAAIPEFTLNDRKEVIAVGQKALAPLNAPAVRALFAKLEAKPSEPILIEGDTDEAEVVLERLPSDF